MSASMRDGEGSWLLKGIRVKRVIDCGIDFGAPTERIMHFPDKTMDHDVDMRRRLEGINPPFPRVSSCFVNYSFGVQFYRDSVDRMRN